MSKNAWKKSISVVGRILLASALVFVQGAWAGQDQKTKDRTDSQQKPAAQQTSEKASSAATTAKAQNGQAQSEESESSVAEKKPSRDGSHEGIKVHGHWTIEVRNPDGASVTHREFENSIQTTGSAALASLLGGNQLLGPWQVDLIGSPQPCIVNTGEAPVGFSLGPEPCVIVPSNTILNGIPGKPLGQVGAISMNLTVTVNAGQLVLNGSVTAATTTSVSSVATVLSPCINSGTVTVTGGTTTFPCPALQFPIPAAFTSATLSQGVPVSTGQTIAVTVVISFS